MKKIRTLIVDDSPTMRRLIRSILEVDARLEIVAEAGTAREARDAVNLHRPDVMTLDVEMPNMSGLEFLERLMRHRPMPVIMVSTLTKKGGEVAIEAMSLGAVECVEKPTIGGDGETFSRLADTVYLAAHARVGERVRKKTKTVVSNDRLFQRICLIGGSTGAVDAIEQVLEAFPENCPPTLITQHMPEPFLASFAARLDPRVHPKVSLAKDGMVLEAGRVLIAPGGKFHLNVEGSTNLRTKLVEGPTVSGHRPSVDSMFKSAVSIGPRVVAAILTGMGRDGAQGIKELSDAGARTIGQSKETCVVFGMPRVAGEMGGIQQWVDIDKLGESLLAEAQKKIEVSI